MPNYDFDTNSKSSELYIDCFFLTERDDNLTDHPPCITNVYEIYYIISGSGAFKLDDKIIEFSAGSILFVAPSKWRQWKTIHGDLDAYVVVFREEFLSSYFHDYLFLFRFHFFYDDEKPFYLTASEDEKGDFDHIFSKIKIEMDDFQPDSKHLLRSYLYYLLVFLNRKYKIDHNLDSYLIDNLQASKFRQLLEANVNIFNSVEEYAEAMNISTTQLNKISNKSFGKNASKIIREKRIKEAKRLILFTTDDIAQISDKLNFSEPSNFNRIFKKETGKTPSKYRNEHFN